MNPIRQVTRVRYDTASRAAVTWEGNASVRHAEVRRRSSIRDVAEHAAVSVGTVSNVLNNPTLVADRTRQRVEQAIRELSFVRNGSARQLRAGTSSAVGAIVLDLANPFFTEVARGVEDRLAEDGYILILCSSDEQQARERRHLHLLEEQGVGGVLITPTDRDISVLDDIRRRGTTVVLLDRTSPNADMCSVAVDDVKGGELAAAHLVSLGHRRLGFVNGPLKIRQCADRRKGVRRALRAAGLPVADSLAEVTVSSLKADGGEEGLGRLIDQPDPPSAIICVNDLIALGVLRGLMARGVRVPGQMAVVGYDDVEFASMLATPLTSVRQPKYQLGWTAADLLMAEVLQGPAHTHQQIQFQPELVVRESSRPHADGSGRKATVEPLALPTGEPGSVQASGRQRRH